MVNEFHFEGPFLKLGQNIGLLVGAAFWGVGSDIWGRKYVLGYHLEGGVHFKLNFEEYLSTLPS